MRGYELDSSDSVGGGGDACERDNEPLGSITFGEFVDWLSDN
jgi:hypothetical protein